MVIMIARCGLLSEPNVLVRFSYNLSLEMSTKSCWAFLIFIIYNKARLTSDCMWNISCFPLIISQILLKFAM